MEARKRLKAWILAHTNQRRFAADIGIDETYLSQVLAGLRTPRLPILARIEAETGIPLNGWVPLADGKSSQARKKSKKSGNVGGGKSHAAVS